MPGVGSCFCFAQKRPETAPASTEAASQVTAPAAFSAEQPKVFRHPAEQAADVVEKGRVLARPG